jgi:hypothetical protein
MPHAAEAGPSNEIPAKFKVSFLSVRLVSEVSRTRGFLKEACMEGAMNAMFRYDGGIPLHFSGNPMMKKAILTAFPLPPLTAMVLVGSLSGCAPGAWNEQSDADKFFDVIENACPQRIGGAEISTLENHNASFLDVTSRLYYGKIDPAGYREFVTSFTDSSAETNQAIDCIIAHLPNTPPPAPGLLPDMGNALSDAPPPPGTP